MCDQHYRQTPNPTSLHRRDVVRGLWTGALVVGVTGVTGCASVAEYLAPTDDQLLEMSAQAWAQTKKETPISRDARANARLQAIGPKIASASGLQGMQWEFVVFDSQEKNAWVLPGGKVGFYKGLMDFVDNDDQVAAVLGHEVGHVAKRHAALRAGEAQAEQLGLALGSYIAGQQLSPQQYEWTMQIAGVATPLVGSLPFSRSHESEADRVGVDYMHTAGFRVNEAVKLWDKMAASGGSRPMEILSTHPDPGRRSVDLKAYIAQKGYA